MATIGKTTKGFVDTKKFRLAVLNNANQRLGLLVRSLSEGNGTQVNKEKGLLSLLDSSYKADVPSTVYALHLKAIAFESSRFLVTTENVTDDIIFITTRGEYFSQNIASFLFPNSRFSQTDSTDEKVRNFYFSIIEAYFGGSTKTNIENSLLKFLEVPVQLIENFLLSRQNLIADDIVKKFTFDIIVDVDDPRIKDINKLQSDIRFLLSIIKPAHTTYETKLLFSGLEETFKKGCTLVTDPSGNPIITHDGFEIKSKSYNTSICDTFHIDYYNYHYEDFRKKTIRKYSKLIENEILQDFSSGIIQSSPRLVRRSENNIWDNTDPSIFHTKYSLIGTSSGNLAISPNDLSVFVNGVQVEIVEVYPLSGAFKLKNTPSETDVVSVTYYFLKAYTGALITNDIESTINTYNKSNGFNYNTVLYPTNFIPPADEIPLLIDYKYKGFDLFNTSILNDPLTLNFNEFGLRDKLNDFTTFKSFGYDFDTYNTSLGEGTPLVPISLDKKDVWRRLPYQEIRLNNNEFIMNNIDDRLFGEIHYDSYHPFYSALELQTKNNGGKSGIVSSLFEDEFDSLFIDFVIAIPYEETINKLGKEYEYQLYTNSTNLNDLNYVIFGENHAQMKILISDLNQESIPQITLSDEKIHISDLKQEFYKENDILQLNSSLLNTLNTLILGNKIKDSEINIEIKTTPFGADLPFIVNSYLSYSTFPGLTISKLTPLFPFAGKLKFLTPRKILVHFPGDGISRITNIRGTNFYVVEATDNTFKLSTTLGGSEIDLIDTGTGIHTCWKSSEYVSMFSFLPTDVGILNNIITHNSHGLSNNDFVYFTTTETLPDPINTTISQDYDLSGLIIYNSDTLVELDETLPVNISVGLRLGDIIESEYAAVDYMNQYEQIVSVFQHPDYLSYSPDYFDYQLLTNVDVQNVLKVSNYTKGYEGVSGYNLDGFVILGNRTIFINKNNNPGKTLDLDDIIFIEMTTVDSTENPAPRLTYYEGGNLITQIKVTPV